MKKLFCLVLCVAVLGGMIVMSGCGGGSGGGILGAVAGVLIIAAVASSGGAGAAVFAASVRERPQSAILSAYQTTRYVARIKIDGDVATITNAVNYVDANTLQVNNVQVSTTQGSHQVLVEFLPASNTSSSDPYFKGYFTADFGLAASIASPTIGATQTAQALAYEYWRNKSGATGKTINEFLAQNPDLATLTAQVINDLQPALGTPTATFQWSTTTTQTASAVANATVVPGGTEQKWDCYTYAPENMTGVFNTINFAWNGNTGTINYSDTMPGGNTNSGQGNATRSGTTFTGSVNETHNSSQGILLWKGTSTMAGRYDSDSQITMNATSTSANDSPQQGTWGYQSKMLLQTGTAANVSGTWSCNAPVFTMTLQQAGTTVTGQTTIPGGVTVLGSVSNNILTLTTSSTQQPDYHETWKFLVVGTQLMGHYIVQGTNPPQMGALRLNQP